MRPVTIEDQATITIVPRCPGCPDLEAWMRPPGCFSSSLTKPITQEGRVRIDADQQVLYFSARFVYEVDAFPYGKGQTGDCGGAGSTRVVLGSLPPGTYSVLLGQSKLGDYVAAPNTPTERQFSTDPREQH